MKLSKRGGKEWVKLLIQPCTVHFKFLKCMVAWNRQTCLAAKNLPALKLVFMPMMNIRLMRMRVLQRLMLMPMAVRFAGRIMGAVSMLMMFVVMVKMFVFQWLMSMPVLMMLREVQPYADGHECTGNQKRRRDGITEKEDGKNRSDKWCG